MDKVIIWVNENKEWFFSGIGVTIVTLIFAAIRKVFCKKKQEKILDTLTNICYYGECIIVASWAYCAHLLTPDYRERQQWKKGQKKKEKSPKSRCNQIRKQG